MESRTRIADGGRVVIPSGFRKALDLEVGDEVIVRLEGEMLTILTPRAAIRRAQELVRRYVQEDSSLVDELILERRAEGRREEQSS